MVRKIFEKSFYASKYISFSNWHEYHFQKDQTCNQKRNQCAYSITVQQYRQQQLEPSTIYLATENFSLDLFWWSSHLGKNLIPATHSTSSSTKRKRDYFSLSRIVSNPKCHHIGQPIKPCTISLQARNFQMVAKMKSGPNLKQVQ